jgi:hypothetical protein
MDCGYCPVFWTEGNTPPEQGLSQLFNLRMEINPVSRTMSYVQNTTQWRKSKNPLPWSIMYHHQNLLELEVSEMNSALSCCMCKCLLVGYVTALFSIADYSAEWLGDRWIGMRIYRTCLWPSWGTILGFALKDWENHKYLRIAGVPAEIWTEHLLNTSPKCYFDTNLFVLYV